MINRLTSRMNAKATAVLVILDTRLDRILMSWLLLAGLVASARILFSGVDVPIAGAATAGSYMLVIVAPFASTLLALRWFANGHLQP